MSDLVAKLSADTSGFTPAVKKAKQALEEYSSIAGRAKRDSEGLTQDQIQGFNRLTNSLQRVGGAFRTTKQDIDTMKNVLRALTAEYDRLDTKTRNTDYGKNLRGVIDSTSQKLNEMRQVQAQTNRTIDEGKNKTSALNGVLNQFSSKLGVSTGMLTKCGLAMAAVTGALKILADSLMSTEDNFDAFNRSVAGAQGVWESFVASVNTADFSNMVESAVTAFNAWKKVYDLKDRAGSYATYNDPAIQNVEAKAAYYQNIINDKRKTEAERKKAQTELDALNKRKTKLIMEKADATYAAGHRVAYNAIDLNQAKYFSGGGGGLFYGKRQGDKLLTPDEINSLIALIEEEGYSYVEMFKDEYKRLQTIAKGRKLNKMEYLTYRYGKILTKVANDDATKANSLAEGIRMMGEASAIARQASDSSRMYNRFSQKDIVAPKVRVKTPKVPKVEKEPLIEGTIAWYQEEIKKLNDQINKKTKLNDTQAITSLKRQRDEIEELLKTKNEMTDIVAKAQRGYATFDELLKLKDYKGNIVGNPLKEGELDSLKNRTAGEMQTLMKLTNIEEKVRQEFENIWVNATRQALDEAVKNGGDWKTPYTKLSEYGKSVDMNKYLPKLISNGASLSDLNQIFGQKSVFDTVKYMGLPMALGDKPSKFNEKQFENMLDVLNQIKETNPIGSETWEEAVTWIDILTKKYEELKEAQDNSMIPEWWDYLASAIGNTGNAIGGLTGKWISSMTQIATLTMQSIDLYNKAKAAKSGEAVANSVAESSKAPWMIQAAVIALNLASVIAGLMQADKFAGGGIVQGSKLGDRNIAQVNGGEMILNTSEQGRLFRLLKGQGAMPNQTATATISSVKVSGSDLYLTLKNYMKNNKTKTL